MTHPTTSTASTRSAHPRPRAVLLAWAVAAMAGPARADIPPPAGYIESCTVEKACLGRASVSCRGSFRDADGCRKEFAPQGLVYACRTRGASVWTEIWCKPAPAAQPAAAASRPKP